MINRLLTFLGFRRKPREPVVIHVSGNIYSSEDFKRSVLEALKDIEIK